jgi:hypothetical protein
LKQNRIAAMEWERGNIEQELLLETNSDEEILSDRDKDISTNSRHDKDSAL